MGKKLSKKMWFDSFYEKYARAIMWLFVLFSFPTGIIITLIFLLTSNLVLTISKIILYSISGGLIIAFLLYGILLIFLIIYDLNRPSQPVNNVIEESKQSDNNI